MSRSKQSIRVLHVLDHSLPHLSGYAVRSRYLLGAQQAWELTPLAVTSPKHGPSNGCEEIEGVRYFRTPARPSRSDLPLVSELRLMWQLAARLREVVRAERVQVVHAHSPVLNGIPALWVARRAGIPVVYEIRAFWEDAAVDHGTHREGSTRYRAIRALETWLSRRVDAVGVISEGLAGELVRRGIPPAKIFRIPNGVDTELFRPMERDRALEQRWGLQDTTVIGFIGSFYRYEGLDVLLQAFAQVSSNRSDARLLLIGSGEALEELRAEARRLGIEERTIFAGSVPHNEIPRCYSVCDVLVYPRKSMRLTELVTPLKPLEAMAAGKAVVASDVGGLRELVSDGRTGLLFPAGNPNELANRLIELIRQPDACAELGERGRQFVCQERIWSKLVGEHARTYARLLGA